MSASNGDGTTGSTQTTYIFIARHMINGIQIGAHKADVPLNKGEIATAMNKISTELKPYGFRIDKSRVTKNPFSFVFTNPYVEYHYRFVTNPKSRNYCAGCGCDKADFTPGCPICDLRASGAVDEVDAMKAFNEVLAGL